MHRAPVFLEVVAATSACHSVQRLQVPMCALLRLFYLGMYIYRYIPSYFWYFSMVWKHDINDMNMNGSALATVLLTPHTMIEHLCMVVRVCVGGSNQPLFFWKWK